MIKSTITLFAMALFIMNAERAAAQPGKAPVDTVAGQTYKNPLPVSMGDPYVLSANGRYYMYGTGAGAKDGFVTYSSTDLVNWKFEGQIYHGNTNDSWCTGDFWAPEVYQVKDTFYLFYSAQWRDNPKGELENFRIGVAVSDKPTGPFKDMVNKPLFDPGYPIIDANVLFDTDGRVYLYYSRCCYKHPVQSEIADWAKNQGLYKEIEESWIYGIELKPDLTGTIGKAVLMLRPPITMKDKQSEWESRSVTDAEANRRWTEGSYMLKKGAVYYMMYSANHFGGKNYAVGYATSKSPLGPFIKSNNNPVLQKDTGEGGSVTGTGHNSVAYSVDGKQMFCVYHGRTTASGDERVVFIDRMEIRKDGSLVVHGPTTTPQPLP
ncbi:MAG: family 43 glycosylhydrolase [Chitinophagaceae bacterium]|nr:family 43 glycosylhydrolase [Chitinophagaceae bacterium]